MKLSSVSLLAAYLLLVSLKAEEPSVLASDATECYTSSLSPDAAHDENCYNDKSSEKQDENVSVVTTEIKAVAATDGDLFHQSSSSSSSCGAYLAESTIPNSGLGVFTARTIMAGEMILTPEPVIQIEDVNLHTHRRLRHHQLPDSSERPWLLSDFWLSSFATMASFEADDVKSVVPGLASSCNYRPGLTNMKRMPPSIQFESHLHRSNDPGTGASTTYHGTCTLP
jgi:hypothetical protein